MPMSHKSGARDIGQGATRAFIAIELPADVKGLITAHIEELKGVAPEGMKWVDPRIAHLTLAFLGNVPNMRLSVLSRIADRVGIASSPFNLQTGSVGAFPNPRRSRVLWLGLEGEIQILSELQSGLRKALLDEGFRAEKKAFNPHVTLGRARGKGFIRLGAEVLHPRVNDSVKFHVREIVLMSSVLTPRGPIHTPLHNSPLRGTADTC